MGAEEKGLEASYWQKGLLVAGVDEVGRGAVAGPLVACAVILKPFCNLPLKDSKKLSKKRRKELSGLIRDSCVSIGIGVVDSALIDSVGISRANIIAMKRALEDLKTEFDVVISDYFSIDGYRCVSFAKADEKSLCCAASSIVAKTFRDEIMSHFDKVFKPYGFEKNVGYLTRSHLKALKEFGPCEIHRFSFSPLKDLV
ncbi:MAG: ribonuclease HII [Aquificaceae bacterium]